MLFAPLEGWRHVEVTDRHTAVDYAHVLKDLADRHLPHAKTIVLVQDNLNIHSKASLYEAFPAAEARRLVERFEWHYTPKHGSWLDLAESELGVLSAQCLDRRIPDKQTLIEEIAAWEHDRNANHTKADWQFTTQSAQLNSSTYTLRSIAENPATAGSDKVDTAEADQVIDAIAKTVAELTSQQDGVIRKQVIEHLMQQIMHHDAEFRREETTSAVSSSAKH